MVSQVPLIDRAVGAQPRQCGQEDELHVCQPKRLERATLGSLPAVRDLPEQETGAVIGRIEARLQLPTHAVVVLMAPRMTLKSASDSSNSPRRNW